MGTRLTKGLLVAVVAILLAAYPKAQDPGSMASRVLKPATCVDGEVIKWNATTASYECQSDMTGAGGLPVGAVILVVAGSYPRGFTEEPSLNGRVPLGTLAANGDASAFVRVIFCRKI